LIYRVAETPQTLFNEPAMKICKTFLAVLTLIAVAVAPAAAQPYSGNIVGYINRTMSPGYNLIADQLLQNPDNLINTVLTNGTPNGASFTKWTGTAFLPPSIFNATTRTWSLNYSLNPGEGAMLWSPTSFVETFFGEVPHYSYGDLPYTNVWSPNYVSGLHLIASPLPLGGTLSLMFTNVVGRLPAEGESVWTLNELSQTYTHSTYDGLTWDNDVSLAVGQSAWFDLGATGLTPPPVPEPAVGLLTALAAATLLLRRQRR
jgi:hypothetical protein